ncbi:Response regulator ArlR [compost metagenome]
MIKARSRIDPCFLALIILEFRSGRFSTELICYFVLNHELQKMKILVVEDEKQLSESIIAVLTDEGFDCEAAYTFRDAESKLTNKIYDLVVLDINLPGGLGFDLFTTINDQKNALPGVLIISARSNLDDKLKGLNLGADDYLVKPFNISELVARVRSIIRRKYPQEANELSFLDVAYTLEGQKVFVNSSELKLTKSQLRILYFLLANKNRVVSKESLCDYVLKDDIDMVDSLDFIYTHIKNLRQKLKKADSDVTIESVYGLGYTLKKKD